MQERLLVVAISLCAVVLVLLGAHRLWERTGAPAGSLEGALAMQGLAVAAVGVDDESPAREVDGFLVAETTETPVAAAPSRAPISLTEPLGATFEDDLCTGRASAWAALRALLDREGPALDATIATRLADAASSGCMVPERAAACAFARETLASEEARGAPLAWSLLAHCEDEIALPLLDRVDAPADAIVRFVIVRSALGRLPVRLPAYLLQSVTSALAPTAAQRERFPFHALADVLGHYDDPSATRALVAMYEVAPDYAREAIGVAIRFPDDDRSRAIHQESCATSAAGSALFACDDGELATRAGDLAFDVPLHLARHPEERAAVVGALEACAAGPEPFGGWLCFRRLAEVDRPRAAAIASSRIAAGNVPLLGLPSVGDPAPYVSSLEHEVRRLPTEGSLVAALASCGIRTSVAHEWARRVSVLDALAARDHAIEIDPESGTFPTPHDRLLRRLARLVAPALDAVSFEQVPPDESNMAVGRYTLRAVSDGRVVETYARNYGDFYDVEAVVGFVNALLVRRGALDRCRIVAADDSAAIVCASLPQLAALESAQLIAAPER